MLQGSCYTRGSASLGAQMDISPAAVEGAEVRGGFLHDPFLGSQGTLLLLSALPQMWGGNFRSREMGVGTGNFFFCRFLRFTCDGLFQITSFPCKTCWDTYSKHCVSESLVLLVLINTWALLLSLVHLAESHSSWEFSTAGEGCSQQQPSQGVKMGCFSSVCSVSSSACHASCSTCEGPLATHCTSCSFPLALRQGQCLASCGEGFYQAHNICQGKLCTWSQFPSCCQAGFVFPLSHAEPVTA